MTTDIAPMMRFLELKAELAQAEDAAATAKARLATFVDQNMAALAEIRGLLPEAPRKKRADAGKPRLAAIKAA